MSTPAAASDREIDPTGNVGVFGEVLVAVGAVPMAIEPYIPAIVRRNFGLRVFLLAFVSIVVAPGIAVVAFDDVLAAALFIAAVVTATGFLGYCEMYRALREINTRIKRVDDGQFDVSFDADRIDEIGETYDALEETARSLGETIERAESERENAEAERERARELHAHLDEQAIAFGETMRAAADGDLTQRLPVDSETESMAEIATAFNGMMDDIEAAVEEIRGFAGEVAAATADAETGAAEIEEASAEVSASVRGIAGDADDQREMLAEVSGEMNDLSATVEEVASSAQTVAETATETAEAAETGATTARDAIDDVREVAAVIDSTVDNVEALEDRMAEIGEIVGLIGDIAEQTNMLALNANIEAARAGSGGGGDGFAVVAEEVKRLAAETGDSAEEIEGLINEVQAQTATTVAEVRTARDHVAESVDAVENVVELFERVSENSQRTDSGIREISDATDDQAASAEEAVSMVEEVEAISRTTAEKAGSASAAAEQQAASVSTVGDTVASLSTVADRLEAVVSAFETGGDHTRPDAGGSPPGRSAVAGDGGRPD
ncbi:methyl-accepting chemotaxis protein [Halobellus ruber]|uniref:HAMP domain-containing protein n=1 Tax=Halobellus ruber TaxID=2761102 RepID=A0A7J9SMA5_9EURY|nr:methyl-accepting chemotaxis protein [Halobellus ruber]MBB6647176.1 HAMP domain-containing protein [Halobellus ruber]